MGEIPDKIQTWQMVAPGKMARAALDVSPLKPGEALIKIAGCGVCHTDLGYFYNGVPTVNPPPLTLGHEISGVVVAGDSQWVGKEVLVPTVMPCNSCPICASGRGNRCLAQKMPGNSLGPYGGFSSHIVVPSVDLCPVPKGRSTPLEHLAIVADAVASPYQAAKRAELERGDLSVVIGAGGGLGAFMTQVCSVVGAKEVVAVDIVPEKLERALEFGATHAINAKGKSLKDVRDEFRTYCRGKSLPNYGWKIFEWSGKGTGQQLALELLSFVGTVIIGGYGTQTNEYQLSRLMAYDADIRGTWGCLPGYYPEVLALVLDGKINIARFLETRPMSQIQQVFEEAHRGDLSRRIVLVPDF